MLLCSAMAGPLLLDVVDKIRVGNPVPAMLLGGHVLAGAAISLLYGQRYSHLRHAPVRPPSTLTAGLTSHLPSPRSAERRVWKQWVSTYISRWSPSSYQH